MTLTDPASGTLLRPQPLGLFDGPAGLLLVPPGPGSAELLDALASGRPPAGWPDHAAAVDLAARGDSDAALAGLGDDRVDVINRFVLAPTPESLAAAREAAADDPALGTVVAAGAYASGLSDIAPTLDGLDGEFAVLALVVRAARALEFKDARAALQLLREAVAHAAGVGPVLHARVLAMLAEHANTGQRAEEALELYDEALDLLAPTDLAELRAGMDLQRGLIAHQLADRQPHRLVEAVRSYQAAVRHFGEASHPEQFALANMNIAVALLAMPTTDSSDQIRLGLAVQSLRAALRVYRPDRHTYEWSACQMNLANALQYLPSKHREDNLAEAVELIEAVLEVRSPRSDPMGYARALANQANALAHLGVFDHAEAKYVEARDLFGQEGDGDAVEVVDRQLMEINEQREAAR
jgi:tetratricopeptide (TPR) repeat protein